MTLTPPTNPNKEIAMNSIIRSITLGALSFATLIAAAGLTLGVPVPCLVKGTINAAVLGAGLGIGVLGASRAARSLIRRAWPGRSAGPGCSQDRRPPMSRVLNVRSPAKPVEILAVIFAMLAAAGATAPAAPPLRTVEPGGWTVHFEPRYNQTKEQGLQDAEACRIETHLKSLSSRAEAQAWAACMEARGYAVRVAPAPERDPSHRGLRPEA